MRQILSYFRIELLYKGSVEKACRFIGLDYSSTVIEASKKIAQNLGYRNMEFKVTDIRNFHTSEKIHMVISLHACNTATDEAIALAVNNNVKAMVMVPCCQQEILKQYSYPPLNYNKTRNFKSKNGGCDYRRYKGADFRGFGLQSFHCGIHITDGDTENLMLRAVKTQGPDEKHLRNIKN